MLQRERSYVGKLAQKSPSRNDAEDRMGGQSHVGRNSVLILYSTVTTRGISSPTRCPLLWGRQLCSSRLSLIAAAGNSMPENRRARPPPEKLPAAFTESEACHLHQKYTQTSSFQRAVNFPFPTCPACAWMEKSGPSHPPPPTPPEDASRCPPAYACHLPKEKNHGPWCEC